MVGELFMNFMLWDNEIPYLDMGADTPNSMTFYPASDPKMTNRFRACSSVRAALTRIVPRTKVSQSPDSSIVKAFTRRSLITVWRPIVTRRHLQTLSVQSSCCALIPQNLTSIRTKL